MIGFQTDPQYRDWSGWVYVEMVFALFLVLEILLRMCVLGWVGYWCGPEKYWNWFDIFLMTTGLSDIIVQLAGATSDIAGTFKKATSNGFLYLLPVL
ncbi:unnamed protein product [Symbiodinium pilosum]|uniref:Ion transport domain-containing protein n=1 Tax=Symbiodinium pilosum TaxID=2952 RepID=A0A812ULW2_SYMPI|nr:unnamed protein product [Symbiodinium pilosum]